MKQAISIGFLVISVSVLITACNSGEVLMSKANAAKDNPPIAAQQRSSSNPTGLVDPIVYFDRVSVRAGKPETLVGLGFLREGALTQSAFGMRFKAPGTFASQPNLETRNPGILYLKPDDAGDVRLLQLDPSTLGEVELARIPLGLKTLAVSSDLRSMAWITSKGDVLAVFEGAEAQPVRLKGGVARFLAFAADSGELQVGLDSSMIVTFSGRGEVTETVQGDSIAREPRSGRIATAVRSESGLEIRITEPSTGRQTSISLNGLEISNLQWSSNGRLTYLLRYADEHLELMEARPETGATTRVVRLNLQGSALSPRIVCPVWHNDVLYFADSSNSSYGIFSAEWNAGYWTIKPFAHSPSITQGFVCPKISRMPGDRS